jgi:hypothetical protein
MVVAHFDWADVSYLHSTCYVAVRILKEDQSSDTGESDLWHHNAPPAASTAAAVWSTESTEIVHS